MANLTLSAIRTRVLSNEARARKNGFTPDRREEIELAIEQLQDEAAIDQRYEDERGWYQNPVWGL